MKKRLTNIFIRFMVAIIILTCIPTVNASAAAADWAGYDCVAYAKARFQEYWGFELHATGSAGANGYYYNAASFGDTISSTPKVGALAVWDSDYNIYGHVAFVEEVNGNQVTYSEGGYDGHYNVATRSTSNMSKSWYDSNLGRICNQPFLGYVYVKGTNCGTDDHIPIGYLDDVTGKEGGIQVYGWAFDFDAVSTPTSIHVYIGGPSGAAGVRGYQIVADELRTDVDDVYHTGVNHGFDDFIATDLRGTQDVYVYAINNTYGGINTELGHKTVYISSPQEERDWKCEILEDGAVEITGYNGKATKVEIPEIINGKSVTSIGDCAFWDCSSLTSIEIPSSVTSIGDHAFCGCSSLTSIEIPSGVTSIGDYAFLRCSSLTSIEIPSSVTSIGNWTFSDCSSLTSIEIPSSVTSIGDCAFWDCSSLMSIEIPSSVTSIGDHAFYGCSSLTSIEIPSGVTSIGNRAFSGCSSLMSINVAENSQNYASKDGILYNKSCKTLICCPGGKQGTVAIPSSVTSIGNDSFIGCSSLTSIEIPSSVTSIGNDSFIGCSSLTSIEIPSSVTSIGNWTFYDCSGLTSIEIPSGVTSIGYYAFYGCSSLTSIEIPSGVTSIGNRAFSGCSSLTSITIPSSVTDIGMWAFHDCSSLTSITIPNSVTSIGNYAFSGCSSLTGITIPNSVTEIGYYVFDNCSPNLTIYGKAGSLAEKYAKKYGIKFSTGNMPLPHTHTYKKTITKATAKTNGVIVDKCNTCGDKKSTTTIYAPSGIKLSKTTFTYNGKNQKPTVTVKDSKGNQLSPDSYKITSPKTSKNVGEYTVIITLQGNYSGTVKLTYQITPKTTSISKLTAKKKSFTVKWKKQTSQTTGYQLQYSTSKKFKGAKTVIVKKNKTISKSIKKLKAGKKYYVRIRTYKTVKVNGKSTKIYSGWSKVKSVKTKKKK